MIPGNSEADRGGADVTAPQYFRRIAASCNEEGDPFPLRTGGPGQDRERRRCLRPRWRTFDLRPSAAQQRIADAAQYTAIQCAGPARDFSLLRFFQNQACPLDSRSPAAPAGMGLCSRWLTHFKSKLTGISAVDRSPPRQNAGDNFMCPEVFLLAHVTAFIEPGVCSSGRACFLTPKVYPANVHCYYRNAGWSSLVARWAHNPKVGGSNPPPATNLFNHLHRLVNIARERFVPLFFPRAFSVTGSFVLDAAFMLPGSSPCNPALTLFALRTEVSDSPIERT